MQRGGCICHDDFPLLAQRGHHATHLPQGHGRAAGNGDARLQPDYGVRGSAVASVFGDQIELHLATAGRRDELGTELLFGDDGRHRLHPGLRAVQLSDMPDAAEFPERLLPLFNFGDHCGHVARAPFPAKAIDQRRRRRAGQQTNDHGKVLRAELFPAGDGLHRLAVACGERRGEILAQRQCPAPVFIERYSLLRHRFRTAGFGELLIKRADFVERFVGPIAAGDVRREADAVGKKDGVIGNLFGGVEVLRHHRRGHDQGVAGVGKTFAGGAIGREFAGWLQRWHTGEIAHGEGVFGVVQAAQDDRAGIAGACFSGLAQSAAHPCQQPISLGDGRLRHHLRRHLSQ